MHSVWLLLYKLNTQTRVSGGTEVKIVGAEKLDYERTRRNFWSDRNILGVVATWGHIHKHYVHVYVKDTNLSKEYKFKTLQKAN